MLQKFNNTEIAVHATNDIKQWYMTVEEVAKGYGVTRNCIMNHLREHSDEIREEVEVAGVSIPYTSSNGVTQGRHTTVIYREGVIKLGFFVRSKQAAMFRQWATDLMMEIMDRNSVTLSDIMERLNQREQRFDSIIEMTEARFDRVEDVCKGLRDEIDELKETLRTVFTDNETKTIRSLIREVKETTGMDGRAVTGQIRATLNVSCIYNVPYGRQIINVLNNMLGKGIKLVPKDNQ